MRVIRIYRWRCTDRAIEPLARHDVRCAKGPSLLAISLIYSGICWQGKNADTPFATVNPEGQARAGVLRRYGYQQPTASRQFVLQLTAQFERAGVEHGTMQASLLLDVLAVPLPGCPSLTSTCS